jgi:hypothetical protein
VLGVGALAANPLQTDAASSSSSTTVEVALGTLDPGHEGFGGGHGLRGHRGEAAEDVAAELGVAVEDYTAAVRAAKEQLREANPDLEPPLTADQRLALRAQFAALVGAELGISGDTVQAAHDAVFEAGLQERVEDGKLTEEEADEIREARANGTLADLVRENHEERVSERLDAALADGRITQEQYDQLQAELADGGLQGFRELQRQFREDSGTFFPRGRFRGAEGIGFGGSGA